MRTFMALSLIALGGGISLGQQDKSQHWDFEDHAVGKLPPGFTAAQTGEGKGSVWKVVEDKSAPSGARVLAQTATGPRPLFNVCVIDATSYRDLQLSVALKAVEGEIDQGGGVVWRYMDADNYYIARYNPLENNCRLYKVVDGQRMQLASKEGLKAPAGEWHTLSITMKGDAIECSLNGQKHLNAKDETFAKAGMIGLWTKADAQTYFDEVKAASIK
ncbi:MAG TPA: family 16 glycoside hydrolase [Pirellulaceae bacterium]|nr:family 16 glycoside hydrolase [Pirellulaceae bacterium]